jgi:nitrate reductase cytochrome c-type subunit
MAATCPILIPAMLASILGTIAPADCTAGAPEKFDQSRVVPAPWQKAGLATGRPGQNIYELADPGESEKQPRIHPYAPPALPHAFSQGDISRNENACLDCHSPAAEGVPEDRKATDEEEPRIPRSHFRDLFTGVPTKDRVIGHRYFCLSCHVPQATEEPDPTK